ncbi:MAG: transcriptional regulator NrdR [Nanohaloarchaea archaeon SW_10_44_10]|nr:MAG: transcriptional regulator NrdR [Nanohaloarchaea archaeon SW_10_44_10]
MQCPYCDSQSSKVIDSRDTGGNVRRRRECSECERRFTTYETAEKLDIKIIKSDGTEEQFDENKIIEGVTRAAEKTSLTDSEIEEVVDEAKKSVRGEKEIRSKEIGEAVKKALKKRDEVAYMRFASVYDSFDDAESFLREAEQLQKN